jgi:hypothetical protein
MARSRERGRLVGRENHSPPQSLRIGYMRYFGYTTLDGQTSDHVPDLGDIPQSIGIIPNGKMFRTIEPVVEMYLIYSIYPILLTNMG